MALRRRFRNRFTERSTLPSGTPVNKPLGNIPPTAPPVGTPVRKDPLTQPVEFQPEVGISAQQPFKPLPEPDRPLRPPVVSTKQVLGGPPNTNMPPTTEGAVKAEGFQPNTEGISSTVAVQGVNAREWIGIVRGIMSGNGLSYSEAYKLALQQFQSNGRLNPPQYTPTPPAHLPAGTPGSWRVFNTPDGLQWKYTWDQTRDQGGVDAPPIDPQTPANAYTGDQVSQKLAAWEAQNPAPGLYNRAFQQDQSARSWWPPQIAQWVQAGKRLQSWQLHPLFKAWQAEQQRLRQMWATTTAGGGPVTRASA